VVPNVVLAVLFQRLFISKFIVKADSISLLSFTLSHFHESSPTLLEEMSLYFLVFHMPKNDQR